MKKVLVLLSTYNGEKYLKQQLDSLLAQQGVDLSILVRDDGSTDGTINILQEYQEKNNNMHLMNRMGGGENVGCANSFALLLNEAYKERTLFDYFAFCDQDDVWMNDKVLRAVSLLDTINDNDKPCCYCSNLNITDSDLHVLKVRWNKSDAFTTKYESLVCSMATGCTMLFNKKVLEFFTEYKPEHLIIHDKWLAQTCLFFGKVIYDKTSYILYRQHSNNVIGMKVKLKDRLKRKWKSFTTLFNQHENETEAKELLKTYNTILNKTDRNYIELVANYKKDVKTRFKFLFSDKVKRKHNNLFLKLRIIIGSV